MNVNCMDAEGSEARKFEWESEVGNGHRLQFQPSGVH